MEIFNVFSTLYFSNQKYRYHFSFDRNQFSISFSEISKNEAYEFERPKSQKKWYNRNKILGVQLLLWWCTYWKRFFSRRKIFFTYHYFTPDHSRTRPNNEAYNLKFSIGEISINGTIQTKNYGYNVYYDDVNIKNILLVKSKIFHILLCLLWVFQNH